MHRFLLDENVRIELDEFLKSQEIDFIRLKPATSDKIIASISRKEKRIVVTNDEDFTRLSKNKIFSVVWLRIPQKDVAMLIASFHKLTTECAQFAGKLIVLDIEGWKSFPLGSEKLSRN